MKTTVVSTHKHTQDLIWLHRGGVEAACTCGWRAVRWGRSGSKEQRWIEAKGKAEQAAAQHAEQHKDTE